MFVTGNAQEADTAVIDEVQALTGPPYPLLYLVPARLISYIDHFQFGSPVSLTLVSVPFILM